MLLSIFAMRCPLCRAVALLNAARHSDKKNKPSAMKKNRRMTSKRAKSKQCKKTWDFEDKWFD